MNLMSQNQFTYESDFDRRQLVETTYHYTLEYDADETLIGGDWGTFVTLDAALEVPDFLYGYPKDAAPLDQPYTGNQVFITNQASDAAASHGMVGALADIPVELLKWSSA